MGAHQRRAASAAKPHCVDRLRQPFAAGPLAMGKAPSRTGALDPMDLPGAYGAQAAGIRRIQAAVITKQASDSIPASA